jgi:hypothetical protein
VAITGTRAGGLLVGSISLDHTPHRADQFAGRDLDQVAITQDRAVRKMRHTGRDLHLGATDVQLPRRRLTARHASDPARAVGVGDRPAGDLEAICADRRSTGLAADCGPRQHPGLSVGPELLQFRL